MKTYTPEQIAVIKSALEKNLQSLVSGVTFDMTTEALAILQSAQGVERKGWLHCGGGVTNWEPPSHHAKSYKPLYAAIQGDSDLHMLEATAEPLIPRISANFECVGDGVAGITAAPIKRIEQEDDGSFTVVIDYWPQRDSALLRDLPPISTAPKDTPILAWCDHEADPVIESGKQLTLYAAHCGGLFNAPTGFHVIEWGGGFDDLPDWWFVAGSEFEVVANPTHWTHLPAALKPLPKPVYK